MSWKDCKSSGPWAFTPQENKWGYLNNPLWSAQQDAIDFCEDQGLSLDDPNQHDPCGHWHKAEVTEEPFPAGKWVAAMQQSGTPYVYVYDILQKAVIRIDTSEIPVFVSSRLELDSAHALDCDIGWGNPGAQLGGYCMNKDATRIWYLFCDQGAYPITRDHPDAQLIEVDISKTVMRVVKKTSFPGLLPAESYPSLNAGRVNDGCSDDTHTYWCTDLIAGRIIKIRNSDHSIIDDHTFNYPIEGCSSGGSDEAIKTIDVNKSTGKLYWVYCRDHLGCSPSYNACRHLIRAGTDLVADINSIACASGSLSPAWQNMIRIYSNYIFHHRAYYPTTVGYLMKRDFDLSPSGDQVRGTDDQIYSCILNHTSDTAKRPITGGGWSTYWVLDGATGGMWSAGINYSAGYLTQEYLQNIFGVKNDKVFTLMHVNSQDHPAFLYCLDFSNMDEISKLDVSYYAGQIYPAGGYDWDWTSVSAMNYQTGVIAIFRYNNVEERNYVACFDASPSLEFLCDVPLYAIRHTSSPEALDEPQVWPLEGFTSPEVPETNPVEVISDPGPGEIIYEPSYPPDDSPGEVPLIKNGFIDHTISIGPKQTLFFKFEANVSDCNYPIQVSNIPGGILAREGTGQCGVWEEGDWNYCRNCGPCVEGQGGCLKSSECAGTLVCINGICQRKPKVHLLIKKGSKPNIADFERTWLIVPSVYDCGLGQWVPAKPGVEDFYWNYNVGHHMSGGKMQTETIEIAEPMGSNTFYIMLYNNGTAKIYNQCLTLNY